MIYIHQQNINELQAIANLPSILVVIPNNYNLHHTNANISFICIHCIGNSKRYVVGINHNDLPKLNLNEILEYVDTSQSFAFNSIYLNSFDIVDMDLAYWFTTNQHYKPTQPLLYSKYTGWNHESINNAIPITIHLQYCDSIIKSLLGIYDKIDYSRVYTYFKGVYKVFKEIEYNVIPINVERCKTRLNREIIYNNYMFYTSTGRPSNTFQSVNLAALNKTDGSRSIIEANHNHALVEFDFEAYHLRLIANIIQYKLPDGNLHEYFGRMFFHTPALTADQYNESKSISFKMAYGGIMPEYSHVEFFQKIHQYINELYLDFKTRGYIETIIYKRKISKENLGDLSSNKLFNYLLQAHETEYNSILINKINSYLFDKKSIFILYTYDSFLFQVERNELKDVVRYIAGILSKNGLSVSVKLGKNYEQLSGINL